MANANMKDFVDVALDLNRGSVEKYSAQQANKLLREAAIEANGGSTKLNYKAIRDGKCAELFAFIEEVLSRTVIEGLQESDYFNTMVDFRDEAMGDELVFETENSDLFFVSEIAEGTQGVRRQRLTGRNAVTIPTTLKAVKIYEELDRLLAGNVDWQVMVNRVGESMKRRLLEDIYTVWMNATSNDLGGSVYNVNVSGTYDEDALLTLIAHVEAAAGGKKATILGTAKGLRNLAPSIQGADSRSDLYNMGYYGKFYGSDTLVIPQRHVAGGTTFLFDDDILTVIAGDDKPIKVVHRGEGLVIAGNPLQNADLTQEYLFADRYGVGIVLAGGNAGIGKYEI